MKFTIQNLHKRIPLTIKMVVLIVILGVLAWVAFNYMQTRALKEVFQKLLSERLSQQAMEDRLSFDRFIKIHTQLATMFITQKNFGDYVEKQNWSPGGTVQVKFHRRPPAWFPPISLLRTFARPQHTILLDVQGKVREVYNILDGDSLPPSLLKPSPLLLLRSRGQNFLTRIDGVPYIVVSEYYSDSQGKLKAILMLASSINDEFLSASLGSSSPTHLVALLTSGENPQIVTSNNLNELPAGALLSALEARYFIAGLGFFDYGDSDLTIKLASFVPMIEIEAMTKSIVSVQRRQQVMAAPVFVLTFILIMFWITRRIEGLTQRVEDFSQYILGGVQQQELKKEKGDQIYVLEERFKNLLREVLEARDALKKEAEEKLLLEKKNMEMLEKERQLNLLHSVTESVGVGVMMKNNGGLQAANKPMKDFAETCGGLPVFDIKDAQSLELRLIDKKGSKRVFEVSSPEVFKEEKIYLVQDVTELKTHTEALEYMAVHDVLTGLPNRTLLYDRLNQAILAGQRERRSFALLMIDVDRFKEINDTLGHHAGDMVLKQVGARLESVLRQADSIARFGGDEFAILLAVPDIETAKQITHRLLNVMKQPIIIDGNNLYVKISVGVALYPVHGEDADVLMKRADVAMYVAKHAQSGFSIYDLEQERLKVNQVVVINELHCAIEQEELRLYYQPKINLKNSSIIGVEALARWPHPQHGLILPDKFISLAEQSSLIRPLTLYVLNAAMRQCAEWHRSGVGIGVSVNLSARNLQDPEFTGQVSEVLSKWGVSPAYLELEITESAMMGDQASAMEILKQLNDTGVRLSIDNFGTGYSSLTHLKRLPVDEIKIFRSFIINMSVDENDALIVRSTIDLAHNLGLKVVAVGVESQQILNMLEGLGCNAVQGNYICPPLSAEEFTLWLSESKWKVSEKI